MRIWIGRSLGEEGSLLLGTFLLLLVLTIVGLSAMVTTQIGLQISGNKKFHKMAFYAAEASRSYVVKSPALYGPENITVGVPMNFPDAEDHTVTFSIGENEIQSFNGEVAYLGASEPPRGSGTQASKFRAHRYLVTGVGYGPANSECTIEAGFYRLGY